MGLTFRFGFTLSPLHEFLSSKIVDMRWGVRDEATDDHMTTRSTTKKSKIASNFYPASASSNWKDVSGHL